MNIGLFDLLSWHIQIYRLYIGFEVDVWNPGRGYPQELQFNLSIRMDKRENEPDIIKMVKDN